MLGNTTWALDVLNTPNMNGVLLNDNSSYITLMPTMTLGGPSTFRAIFKYFNISNNHYTNNTVIFACSSGESFIHILA